MPMSVSWRRQRAANQRRLPGRYRLTESNRAHWIVPVLHAKEIGPESAVVSTHPPTSGTGSSRRIGFLFNHEHLHQIAHGAPIAFELSRLEPGVEVLLLASTSAQLEYLRTLSKAYPGARCAFVLLQLPRTLSRARPLLDPWLPYSRIAMLVANRALFATLDVLVAPEKTSLLLRTRLGLRHLKFVHTRHGAGDREVGFDRSSGAFDLVLMSGPKVRDRLRAAGLLKEDGHAIVGYAKFDLLRDAPPPPRLFDNDRPTVVYNPHSSPALSSWYRHGHAILDYFYHSTRYNLIFAPHVMLFRKRWQVSLEHRRVARPGVIPDRYRHCPHLLIDTGSARSVDMTYTRAADVYLGDASSQIYEFLMTPRPCVFVDAHETDWQHDVNHTHWQAGPVIRHPSALDGALESAVRDHSLWRVKQQALFAYSFDFNDKPSALRGAEAIRAFMASAATA